MSIPTRAGLVLSVSSLLLLADCSSAIGWRDASGPTDFAEPMDSIRIADAEPTGTTPTDAALPVACAPPGAPGAGAAIIFQAPSPVGPGETALLFGARVGTSATVTGVRIADSLPGEPPRIADCVPPSATKLTVLEATDLSVKATIPSAWTPGLYALLVTNASGVSAPIVLNRPRIDWIHSGVGGTVVSGGTIDVYGRSFGAKPSAWLVDSSGKSTALTAPTASTSDGYLATFNVPTLAAGAYRLYVHSGLGGPYGFSDALTVDVVATTPWPTTVYAVAAGTGNDDAAVATAIGKATAAGGGIVEFAKGSYTLTKGVTVPPKTVVRSASGNRADVTITFNQASTPFPWAFAGSTDFRVESITVTSSTSARLFQCPAGGDFYRDPATGQPQYQPDAPCSNATLHDVSFTLTTLRNVGGNTMTPTYTVLAVIDGNDSEISDSTLANEGGSALYVTNAQRDYILRNTLVSGTTRVSPTATEPLTHSETAVGVSDGCFESISDSAIVGNTVGPTANLGAAITLSIEDVAHDLYIADNKIGPNTSDFGEGFSVDAPYYPLFIGIPTSATGKSMTIPTVLNQAGKSVFGGPDTGKWAAGSGPQTTTASSISGAMVVVVNGTGLGQYAEVVSNAATAADGTTALTLDRELVVPLDGTSVVQIAVIKSKVVFVRNEFNDVAVGVQLYAGGYDFIIDGTTGNSIEGTYCFAEDGMSERSSPTDVQRRLSTCYFDQWLNNTLTNQVDADYPWAKSISSLTHPYANNGLVGIDTGYSADTLIPAQHGIGALGNVMRGNAVQGFTVGLINIGNGAGPAGQDNIIEQNQTESVAIGFLVESNFPGTILQNDTCASGCQMAIENLSSGTP